MSYRGRSGCCAGVDQIASTVPNVTGCRVPVTLKINDVVSNSTSMAISQAGTKTCSDPGGPSASDLQRFSTNGASIARIVLTRTSFLAITDPSPIFLSSDLGTATFFKYSAAQLNTARNPFNITPVGSCSVNSLGTTDASTLQTFPQFFPNDPIAPISLNAGASITVTAAGVPKMLRYRNITNSLAYYYDGLFDFGQLPGFLEPGTVTISGPGGRDVGAFQFTVDVPAILKWTNLDSVLTVNRAAGQLVTWTGGDPAGTVKISGFSSVSIVPGGTQATGAEFTCTAKTSGGQFMIPPSVLLSLPVNSSNSNTNSFGYGRLQVGTNTALKSFTASGVDFATAFATLDAERLVDYK